MPPRDPYQPLADAIRALHGCEARHVASKPVREIFQGQTAWVGIVEEFALSGHPKATTCYAWQYHDSGQTYTVTVLALPPVDSSESAVKVAVAAEIRG